MDFGFEQPDLAVASSVSPSSERLPARAGPFRRVRVVAWLACMVESEHLFQCPDVVRDTRFHGRRSLLRWESHYTSLDGLPYNAGTCILAEPDGTLLFGTEGGGVCRYDGQEFVSLTDCPMAIMALMALPTFW